MMREAKVLTGVYVATADEDVRYQFVAVSRRSALLRREVQIAGHWREGGDYAICPLNHLIVDGSGIVLAAAARLVRFRWDEVMLSAHLEMLSSWSYGGGY